MRLVYLLEGKELEQMHDLVIGQTSCLGNLN